MLANPGKENTTLDEETKTTVPKSSLKAKVKAREFGRELTNTNAHKKAKLAGRTAKLPKTSSKVPKIAQHGHTPPPPIKKVATEVDWETLDEGEVREKLKEELAVRKKKLRETIPDYDMFRVRDAQEVGEYVEEIFSDMKAKQEGFRVAKDYLSDTLTLKDRASLIDFVEELHAIFDLIPETLFVSIATMDRFLSLKDNASSFMDLQRVAVAAVLIVSKYEDIIPPSLDEMIKQMKKPCSREDILLLETRILVDLDFDLTVPTAFRFLERFSRISPKYNSAMDFGEFVIELANYDFSIVRDIKPSEVAAVALFVGGIATSGIKKWTKPLEKATGVSGARLKEVCLEYF